MWKLTGCVISIMAASLLGVVPAHAAATRTFVSGHGTDSGICSPSTSPCRTLAYAITQTAAGGEITVLDSAGYGAVTITQSVTVTNPGGVEAGISAGSGATAVTVNIGSSDTVSLRGLTIEGAGIAANGIVFSGSGTLNVLDCTVRDMTQVGISVTPSFGGDIVIADTTVANNNVEGVFATADGSGSLTLSLSHVKVINNGFSSSGYGFRLTGGAAAYGFVTIDSSLIAQNGTGLALSASGSNVVTTFVTHSNILNNAQSVSVGAGTSLKLEKTSIATSFSGNISNSGEMISFGDNAILDSISGNALTSAALQ